MESSLEERRGSYPLHVDSFQLKRKVNDLGTGFDDLNARVETLEHSSPDEKRQRELEKSKQEVRKLKEELKTVKTDLEKITTQSQNDQTKLQDCQEKIQHLEIELEEKKANVRRLEEEMGGVKEDLKTTKADLQKTAVESRANKEDLASTKQELAATKQELGGTKLKLDQHTADIEYLKQVVTAGQHRTPGATQPIQCTEPPPDNAGAQAMVELGQRGQRQTRTDQPRHTGQPQRERREQAAVQNPQAQPLTSRRVRQSSFPIPNPSDKPVKYMPGKK
ncbi:moesin-like [Littorina saxatilis]|uniref:Uncharacterized protein n=1 Tax=Littorina saxatilis TaxID=31220 RepID=A0AAN9AMD1_9CAEN